MTPQQRDSLLSLLRRTLLVEFAHNVPHAILFAHERAGNLGCWLELRDSTEDPPLITQLVDSLQVVFTYSDFDGPNEPDKMRPIAARLDVAIREWNRDNGHPIDLG